MEKINYGLVDELSRLAQNPREWKKTYGNLPLIQVLAIRTGRDYDTIQSGEIAKEYSGVHGKKTNLIRLSPAKCTSGVEKLYRPKAKAVIIRRQNGDVLPKRLINNKWCNSNILIK